MTGAALSSSVRCCLHAACSGRLRGAKAKNPDLSQIPQSQFQSSLSCRPLLYSYKRYHSPKTKLPSFSSRYCLFIANNAILYLSCSLLPLRYRYDCREGGPPRTTRVTLLTAHWSGTDRRPATSVAGEACETFVVSSFRVHRRDKSRTLLSAFTITASC